MKQEIKEKLKELHNTLRYHFRCDCLACVNNTNSKICPDFATCEVAQSYNKILIKEKELVKLLR
jgi:hypothetical protein